jgi:excisionase family DNA binding protein
MRATTACKSSECNCPEQQGQVVETEQPHDSLPFFVTVEEAAELLRLDRKTVYAMIKRGELPGARRFGRTYRIHLPTLLEWFAAGQRPARRGGKR